MNNKNFSVIKVMNILGCKEEWTIKEIREELLKNDIIDNKKYPFSLDDIINILSSKKEKLLSLSYIEDILLEELLYRKTKELKVIRRNL